MTLGDRGLSRLDGGELPLHLALMEKRLENVGVDASADTWLTLSYVFEVLLKTTAICLVSGIGKASHDVAYALKHGLIHADGLGTWETVIGECCSQSKAGYINREVGVLVEWLTKKRRNDQDPWIFDLVSDLRQIFSVMGLEPLGDERKLTVLRVLSLLVQLRNKTKAHGAMSLEFYEATNLYFWNAIIRLVNNCPVIAFSWYYIAERGVKKEIKAQLLKGLQPKFISVNSLENVPVGKGIYFQTHENGNLFAVEEMILTSPDLNEFLFPNGSYKNDGRCDYLDYGTGQQRQVDRQNFMNPPAPLPASETEGFNNLDVYSNIIGNFPARASWYVNRPGLEEYLQKRLLDENHPIITLHGRGGIGKTSLALNLCHTLGDLEKFELVLWLSARDLELLPRGAKEVRRAISDIDSIAKKISRLLNLEDTSKEMLSTVLRDPQTAGYESILFIFDNFETLDNPKAIQKFLDTHTHLPNKVLITSRERTFKGDYPIEVRGMERDEALTLLRREAIELQIESLVDLEYLENLFEDTNGHPYIMRVLLGEIQKEGRRIPLKSLIPKRPDVLGAVFERSFNKLSQAGKWVFLLAGNWRSLVPEIALRVLLELRDLDALDGIEECIRFSLIHRNELSDESEAYDVPNLARHFARKKLNGDPDQLMIEEDIKLLQLIGPINRNQVKDVDVAYIIDKTLTELERDLSSFSKADYEKRIMLMQELAEYWPSAWVKVARIRKTRGDDVDTIKYALRKAVEEQPEDAEAWILSADYSKELGDNLGYVTALVYSVEADPTDVRRISFVAHELANYVVENKREIPAARRGAFLARVRSHFCKAVDTCSATDLSRLAWLYLLEGDEENARKYAKMGFQQDPHNNHCENLLKKLSEL